MFSMRDIVWSNLFVQIPGAKRHYGLPNLVILSDHDPDFMVPDGTRSVILALKRSNEPLCRVVIGADEEDDFRSFQNSLLTSKLRE